MSEKISQMPDGDPAQSGDQVPIARSGSNLAVTAGSIAALASGATADFFVGPGLLLVPWEVSGAQICRFDNEVRVWEFSIAAQVDISTVSFSLQAGVGTPTIGCGLYSRTGTALLRTSFTTNSTNPITNSVGPATLPPGTYYLAQSANDALDTQAYGLTGISPAIVTQMNATGVRYGFAANSMLAGVMPATLGTITVDNTHIFQPVLFSFN